MRATALAFSVILVSGCGGSEFTPEGDADAGSDPGADTASETGTDPGTDPAVEPEEDVAPPDLPDEVVEDPSVDAMPDGPCSTDEDCGLGLSCCGARCANPSYDPDNCGGCGNVCPNHRRFCNAGACEGIPCEDVSCIGIQYCCGVHCCDMDQICCIVEGPGPVVGPQCYDGFCPGGCPSCD